MLEALPELEHLANEIQGLPTLSEEAHESYVLAVAKLASAIRYNVANDPLARGASAMKAIYQVQYLLEQYRTRPQNLSAHILASAFSRIKDDTSAVQLMSEMLDAA